MWSYLLITVEAHSQARRSCKRPQYIKTGLSPSPPTSSFSSNLHTALPVRLPNSEHTMNPIHTTANGIAFWSRGETTEEDPTALWSGTAGYGQPTLGFNSALSLSQPQDIEWGAAATVENSHRDIMAFALPGHGTNPTIPRPHLFPLFLTAIHATSVVQISTSLALGSRRPLPLWGRVLFQRHQEILHGMTSLGERPRGGEEASCTSAGESRRPVTVTRESAGLDSGVRGRPPAVSDHRAVWSCSVVSPQN